MYIHIYIHNNTHIYILTRLASWARHTIFGQTHLCKKSGEDDDGRNLSKFHNIWDQHDVTTLLLGPTKVPLRETGKSSGLDLSCAMLRCHCCLFLSNCWTTEVGKLRWQMGAPSCVKSSGFDWNVHSPLSFIMVSPSVHQFKVFGWGCWGLA
jgi:hypothetical protein